MLGQKPTIWQVILSVLAAWFGVQSEQARERDFTQGNPFLYLAVGLIGVILLMSMLYLLVKWIV